MTAPAPVDTAAHAAALNAPAPYEPRTALYAWGLRVIALDDLVNDGSYSERADDAVLAARGAVGEIVNTGHATESNEPVYLVEFGGCVIGCFEDEIAPAPLGLLPETDEVQGGMSAAVAATAGAVVVDLMQRRLERALRERTRYRYVRPRVLREGDAFRIESPCCSRNVDADGGVIDIALLAPGAPRLSRSQPGRTVQSWRLFARDHAAGAWVAQDESDELGELMDVLCVDAQRIFWP